MSSPPVIRSLAQDDLKLIKYQIGLSEMGPLAVANNKGYFHPLTVAVWLALSAVMIQFLNMWPVTDGSMGFWGVLSPVPAFASIAVPVMFFFDWFHRPTFEEALHKALTAVDMQNPLQHYSLSPASGFYILENNGKSIGLIALDASSVPQSSRAVSTAKVGATAETAIIRHFFVEEQYRVADVQSDLLDFAVSRAFAANLSSRPRTVRIISSELESYKTVALYAAKFHPVSKWDGHEPKEWKVGVFGWRSRWVEIDRDEWKAKRVTK